MPQDTAEPMTDNQALNSLVEQLDNVIGVLTDQYDSIEGDETLVAVSNASPVTRTPDALAVKIIVTNGGDDRIRVYQGGVLVALIDPGESESLPMNGSDAIKVDCATGESSLFAMATFKKSA